MRKIIPILVSSLGILSFNPALSHATARGNIASGGDAILILEDEVAIVTSAPSDVCSGERAGDCNDDAIDIGYEVLLQTCGPKKPDDQYWGQFMMECDDNGDPEHISVMCRPGVL